MVSLTENKSSSINILLVEDDPGDVVLISQAFKDSKKPIHIKDVRDGVEAMDFLKGRGIFKNADKPNLVLLDLNMPRKDGFEVLDEIKTDPDLAQIPVVILTNSRLESDVQRAYASSANFYLVKPSGLVELYVAMRRVEELWLKHLGEEAD